MVVSCALSLLGGSSDQRRSRQGRCERPSCSLLLYRRGALSPPRGRAPPPPAPPKALHKKRRNFNVPWPPPVAGPDSLPLSTEERKGQHAPPRRRSRR